MHNQKSKQNPLVSSIDVSPNDKGIQAAQDALQTSCSQRNDVRAARMLETQAFIKQGT